MALAAGGTAAIALLPDEIATAAILGGASLMTAGIGAMDWTAPRDKTDC